MPPPKETLEPDFDAQLRGLFQQAERALEHRAVADVSSDTVAQNSTATEIAPARPVAPAAGPSLLQALRPLVQGLEAIVRLTSENTTTLEKIESAAASQNGLDKELPQIAAELRGMLELKNGVNQSMFAALHEELKGYKDGFLLEAIHRPIIRDLVSLYDDTAEIFRQATNIAGSELNAAGAGEQLHTMEMNIDHNLGFLVEVLARLEVTLIEPHTGKLDKKTQRVVSMEIAEDPDQDGDVVRIVRRGFLWRSRIFRPEEVVIRKWKEGFLAALQPSALK